MKRIISLLLVASVFLVGLSSCRKKEASVPTCNELIAAYTEAGYQVFHVETEDKENGYAWDCYVKIWLDDESDYAFFHFFENAKEAEAYADTRQYNVLIYLFSVIYGDPSWLHTKTYGNIEYEYENSDLLKPFNNLIEN